VRAAVIAAALALAAAGCSGDATSGGSRIPICEVRFAAPDGFAPSETHEERYDDRIGVRLGFADDAGRELHVFAGIRGEFGEGLPGAGDVDLADGGTAAVLGRDDVWVVRWDAGDVCDPRVVLVNGFDRDGLQEVLSDAGLVASG